VKPVKQTIIHNPDNGMYGDCFRACVASLLEKPIEKVPHFCNREADREGIFVKRGNSMKIKIGNEFYDDDSTPMMIILSDQDKLNISNMDAEATKYAVLPDDWGVEKSYAWMDVGNNDSR